MNTAHLGCRMVAGGGVGGGASGRSACEALVDLVAKMLAFIEHHSESAKPFTRICGAKVAADPRSGDFYAGHRIAPYRYDSASGPGGGGVLSAP